MNTTFQNRSLDRRTLLRGVSAALALPFLEAMRPAIAPREEPRRRALFVFLPNGVKYDEWKPAREGRSPDLPYLLEPLEPVRSRLTVISGLALDGGRAHGDGPGDHARAAASFLTCAHPKKTGGADLQAGISVDQVLAAHVGSATRFPSLELGLERGSAAGICDSGYSCAYSNNVSWRSPSTPVAKEVEPRAVFARLFGDPDRAIDRAERDRERQRDRSVLDAVLAEAKALRGQLGAKDGNKLDDYLEAVRELERRLQQEEHEPFATPPVPAGVQNERGDYREKLAAMYELLALAFATDQTRVATLMLGNAGSNRSYRFLGVPEGHHDLSHHGKDPHKLAGIRAIVRFQVEGFATFLQRLAAERDGDSDLLARTSCVFASGLCDGDRHDHENLPVLLAGGRKADRHLVLARETPMANLYLALLREHGCEVERFGDSTGALSI